MSRLAAAISFRTESGDHYTGLYFYRRGYPELLIKEIKKEMGDEFAYICEVHSDFEEDLGEYNFDNQLMIAVYEDGSDD